MGIHYALYDDIDQVPLRCHIIFHVENDSSN